MIPNNLIYVTIFIVYNISTVSTKNVSFSRRSDASDNNVEENHEARLADSDLNDDQVIPPQSGSKTCWMTLNAKKHFNTMDNFENRHRDIFSKYQDKVGAELDAQMLHTLIQSRGIALRAVDKAGGNPNIIPAGLNLGGYCMMRMMDSVLFFHRMKLRNNTRFRVNFLHNDFLNMTLTIQLSLNDLHLIGAYERSPTDKDPSVLFYAPTYGQVEFLLKNVEYKMEGRLRLLKDRLFIELVISDILVEDILMTYLNDNTTDPPVRLQKKNIDDFIERLKTDLDMWLKDYLNDYVTYFKLPVAPSLQMQQAEKQKNLLLNEYADYAISAMKNKIRQIGAASIKIPQFTIVSAQSLQLKLTDGVIRGLDSMYRRSVATSKKENSIRKVDLLIGFSSLKVEYKYEAILPTGIPPLNGILILSADELTSHMGLSLVKDPESVDLEFDFLQQMKPESLTVEGAANGMIANFKHLLEHHIIAIMSNTLVHSVKLLRTLSKCEPFLFSHDQMNTEEKYGSLPNEYINSASDENDHNEDQQNFADATIQETLSDKYSANEEENEPQNPPTDDQTTDLAEHPIDELSQFSHEEQTLNPQETFTERSDKEPDYSLTKNDSVEQQMMRSNNKHAEIVKLRHN